MNLYDKSTSPGAGWYWSKRLSKWRRKPFHSWAWDRQGIHSALGLGVGLTALIPLLYPSAMVVAMVVAFQVLYFWRFLEYEKTESRVIRDEEYVDLGGEMIGWVVGSCIAAVVLVGRLVL